MGLQRIVNGNFEKLKFGEKEITDGNETACKFNEKFLNIGYELNALSSILQTFLNDREDLNNLF